MTTTIKHEGETMKYRLHITCPAKHTTYIDFKTLRGARNTWHREYKDKECWFATHIEVIKTNN